MRALRLDMMPLSDDPQRWPEQGSVLTNLKVEVEVDGEVTARGREEIIIDVGQDAEPIARGVQALQSGVGVMPIL